MLDMHSSKVQYYVHLNIGVFSQVIIFPGRKLEYGTRYYRNEKGNCFMTAVEFSGTHPYGKAVALMDLANGFLEVLYLFSKKQHHLLLIYLLHT